MCVKMLNPKEDEFIIDPACGSGGFILHTMYHVWDHYLKNRIGSKGICRKISFWDRF